MFKFSKVIYMFVNEILIGYLNDFLGNEDILITMTYVQID